MCKKKLLSAAIGTALAMGAGVSYAATFELTKVGGVTYTTNDAPPTYASEDVGVSGTQTIADEFEVTYTLSNTINSDLYVEFSLEGATWQAELLSSALEISGPPTHAVSLNGKVDQSTVRFTISAGTDALEPANNPLVFTFKLADIYGLSSPGGEVSITASLTSAASGATADTTLSEVVAISGKAVDIVVEPDTVNSRTAIDVAQGSTVFVDSIDETTVSLGTIKVAQASSSIQSVTGSAYSFNVTAGSLTVLNGIFAASLSNNGVFIDVGGATGVYDSLIDFEADTVDATTATWIFTPAELTTLYTASSAKNIIVKVDGTTAINDNTDPPSATLLVEFETDRIVSGTLKHVKRNGTTCTIYNVPAPGAVDDGNIRVTNKSATKTGVVLGTLWDKDGNALFTNQTLVAELAPLNTTRLTPANLAETLTTATEGVVTGWGGRAVLVLSSDLTDMEAFNLLRNAGGGPLLNMSTGGTGNSCD